MKLVVTRIRAFVYIGFVFFMKKWQCVATANR